MMNKSASKFLASRLDKVKPSPTVAITAKANQLKADGGDIIALAAGEPDFDTPANIVAAAKKALDDGLTRYAAPAGDINLRKAIIAKLKRENGVEYTVDQICVASGGKQIIFNAIMASVEEGDEVIIPAPYWVSYPDITLLAGGTPVFLNCPVSQNFKLLPEQLAKAITPKTKWLILNSPSNPTGAAYSEAEIKALGEVLLRPENSHVYILSDDIYEHIIYDDFKFSTLSAVVPELKERVLLLNGFAKAYAMTGWRLGYGAGPLPLIKAMVMLNSQSITSSTTFVQIAAIEALNGTQDFIPRNNQQFKLRRDFVVKAINQIKGLKCAMPEGAFYVYPSCEGLIGLKTPAGKVIANDTDFVTYILEAKGLACVQGAAFGLEPYFRISYATSMKNLEMAMDRLKQACDDLR